jgi:hypothetical protein
MFKVKAKETIHSTYSSRGKKGLSMQFPCAQVKSVCKKENKGITNIVGYSNANRVGSPIDR